MDTSESLNLLRSPSERLTLKYVAEGELFEREMDWLAVQRLIFRGRHVMDLANPEMREC
jgi:hypothetical protein